MDDRWYEFYQRVTDMTSEWYHICHELIKPISPVIHRHNLFITHIWNTDLERSSRPGLLFFGVTIYDLMISHANFSRIFLYFYNQNAAKEVGPCVKIISIRNLESWNHCDPQCHTVGSATVTDWSCWWCHWSGGVKIVHFLSTLGYSLSSVPKIHYLSNPNKILIMVFSLGTIP